MVILNEEIITVEDSVLSNKPASWAEVAEILEVYHAEKTLNPPGKVRVAPSYMRGAS